MSLKRGRRSRRPHCQRAALTALLLATGAFAATDPPAEGEQNFGSWTAKCEAPEGEGPDAGGCFIFQNLVLRAGGQRVLQIAIGYVPGTAEPIALLSLPLGISLPPGVSIEATGGAPMRFPVERCEPNGCRAGLRLKQDFLDELLAAETLTVRFHDAQRQPIEVPLAVSGLADGLEALKAGALALPPANPGP